MIPRATYRIQFNRDFPFARAQELVPYFARLGISHLYASPITKAASGSNHGYDVVDPTQVNPELGGEDGLRSLVAALRACAMGLIIDIVPNHMGVAGGENAYWNDVLRRGEASAYARYFDIDWRRKLLLPILGAPLEDVLANGDVTIETVGGEPLLTFHGAHRLTIRPEDLSNLPRNGDTASLARLIDRQHYRPTWWRAANDELNWRRFFTINELAGIRVEDPRVFEATQALYFRLYREGLIDGVRVDHIDGLTDPAGYCRQLRDRLDALPRPGDAPSGPAYIVVEKILGRAEALPEDWGIDGTSGYDFMEQASALLHDPAGEAPLTALWQAFTGRERGFCAEELQARREMLSWAFEGQLAACVEAFDALAASAPETRGLTQGMLRRAIERLLWVFPVYRTYGTGDCAPPSDAATRAHARQAAQAFTPPGESDVVERILAWLAGEGPGDAGLTSEAVRKFQQLSAPIAAKAVEDTAFYRYGRLLSRTDVGFDAQRFAMSPDEFHQACAERARTFPHAMLATATHDHKRGEDVRARLAVLSAIPDIWREQVTHWDGLVAKWHDGIDPADRYIFYQTLYGAWPDALPPHDAQGLSAFAERLCTWQEKALREATLRSNWVRPDAEYEARCRRFIQSALDPQRGAPVLAQVHAFVTRTAAAAMANSLVQTALRCTVPGMPDLYQGTERADLSLVDPDNRQPVDFSDRRRLLASPATDNPKFALLLKLLHLRQAHPDLFGLGDYRPLAVQGPRATHVLAFRRQLGHQSLECAVILRAGKALYGQPDRVPKRDWWGNTRIMLDAGPLAAGEAFLGSPVFLHLQGTDDSLPS